MWDEPAPASPPACWSPASPSRTGTATVAFEAVAEMALEYVSLLRSKLTECTLQAEGKGWGSRLVDREAPDSRCDGVHSGAEQPGRRQWEP